MSKPYNDPYAVLGVERTASSAEIKKAYFALVREYPPERAPDAFKRVRAAYERLRDPEQRLETEILLLRPWPEASRKRRMPKLDTTLHHEDVLTAAAALSDLERRDWREYHEKVRL
jgi:curved DNA-binding protein CbpA